MFGALKEIKKFIKLFEFLNFVILIKIKNERAIKRFMFVSF